MTPDFAILLDGRQDLTDNIRKRLVSLGVQDSSDDRSDACEIVMTDTTGELALPKKGEPLQVRMGYWETGLQNMGTFFVDESRLSGPPDTLSIHANSADFLGKLKEPKQRNWSGRTLSAIVETIATDAGYEPHVQAELQGHFFDRLYQDNESGHQFLRRVANMLGAVYKPNGRRLAIFSRDSKTSVSGQSLDPVQLNIEQLTEWEFANPDRAFYDTVRTWWHDDWRNKYLEVFVQLKEDDRITVDSKNPGGSTYTLRSYFDTKDKAVTEARAMLQRLRKQTELLTIVTLGNTGLLCEVPVTISGGRPELSKDWIVVDADHRLSSEGYITSATLSLCVSG